jgi:hypothetical protein
MSDALAQLVQAEPLHLAAVEGTRIWRAESLADTGCD